MFSKRLLSSKGEKQPRLAMDDVDPMIPSQLSGNVHAPGEWISSLRNSTRIDYARSRSLNKDAGAGMSGGSEHTAANIKDHDM